MRVLLDECLNWRLARGLPDHTVSSVQRMGCAGIRNGELLALAEKQFDGFITGDRNLSFQQKIRQTGLSVVVLAAKSTQLKDTLSLMEKVGALLSGLRPGMIEIISR